jgi:cellulose synthase/poly-beta-1,6-N-acetylglucosamine synthase-like glycosyltransferase
MPIPSRRSCGRKESRVILILITILAVINGLAAGWLLLYGLNAYWLTLVRWVKPARRSRLSPLEALNKHLDKSLELKNTDLPSHEAGAGYPREKSTALRGAMPAVAVVGRTYHSAHNDNHNLGNGFNTNGFNSNGFNGNGFAAHSFPSGNFQEHFQGNGFGEFSDHTTETVHNSNGTNGFESGLENDFEHGFEHNLEHKFEDGFNPTHPDLPSDLPLVTVQLPIFNERYVSRRLVDAVCQLDWPKDKLQIQVLDDSTDDTQNILQDAVAEYQAKGVWIEYLHRVNRQGFKAGALQEAMPKVKAEYIAIFDADFVPSTDWLKRTMQHYLHPTMDRLAVVQTRWGHINAEYSLLTKLQAVNLDGHFAVEQEARHRRGYFLNFNGTAGIWYKQAIIDSGGWHADTLAEDMDLSYRAQMGGWKIFYDNSIATPAELPVAITAFKLQQFRWAKGGIQCAKKLLGKVWFSPLPVMHKWQATVHLTGHIVHPLLMILVLMSVPLLAVANPPSSAPTTTNTFNLLEFLWGAMMLPATFGPPFLYSMAQKSLHPQTWHRRLGRVFMLALLGTGISWSNTRAVIAGFLNTGANFRRTPKFDIKYKSDRWENKAYAVPLDGTALVELGLCAYSFIAVFLAASKGLYLTLPFMLLYAVSYGYVGSLTLWQSWHQAK